MLIDRVIYYKKKKEEKEEEGGWKRRRRKWDRGINNWRINESICEKGSSRGSIVVIKDYKRLSTWLMSE